MYLNSKFKKESPNSKILTPIKEKEDNKEDEFKENETIQEDIDEDNTLD